ncbi:hypothetical protein [Bosea sp. (in: a-proteobacteria)]|uniref:hypothetical protein n=1 Tax=Bosea sp. (in: a-proteobacteria) TaxID=1871050 RepID=UPI000AB41FEB|nr:hypothetical protein [Bosea sp. (in: a-proteobacteria)]
MNVSNRAFSTVAPADDRFWDLLNAVVQSEPVELRDPVTLGFFAAIGIEKGKPFKPDERMKRILTEAAAVGDATARTLTYKSRIPRRSITPTAPGANGWEATASRVSPGWLIWMPPPSSIFTPPA